MFCLKNNVVTRKWVTEVSYKFSPDPGTCTVWEESCEPGHLDSMVKKTIPENKLGWTLYPQCISIYKPQFCVFTEAFEMGKGNTSQDHRILDDTAEEQANT